MILSEFLFPSTQKVYLDNEDLQLKKFTPSIEEINRADSIAKAYIKTHRNEYYWTDEIKNYDRYYKQYVGLLSGNTKFIYINAAVYKFSNFFENISYPRGGGNGYFRIKVNLINGKIGVFNVNAPK